MKRAGGKLVLALIASVLVNTRRLAQLFSFGNMIAVNIVQCLSWDCVYSIFFVISELLHFNFCVHNNAFIYAIDMNADVCLQC